MHRKARTSPERHDGKTIYFLSNGFVSAYGSFTLNVDRIGLSKGDELAGVEVRDDNEELVRFLWGIGGGARPGSADLLGGGGGGGGFFPNEGCLTRFGGSPSPWISANESFTSRGL
jgi:hypothetical protein